MPGDARARSPPGAPPEAATAATGRGGLTDCPTPNVARASSSQVFKESRRYLRVRLSRLNRGLAADVAEGSPPLQQGSAL